MKSKSIEELNIGHIPGNTLIVKRFEMPTEDADGFLNAEGFSKDSEGIQKDEYRPLFQLRGEIVGIGAGVTDEAFELGDVVHLAASGDLPIYMDKTDPDQWDPDTMYVNTPYVRVDASYGVVFVEKSEL